MAVALYHHRFIAMGGPNTISLYSDSAQQASRVFGQLEQEVRRLERQYSRFLPDSLISRLNRGELNAQPLNPELTGLLNYAQQCFDLSDHMFDPTVGSIRKLWNYNESQLPNPEQLLSCLERVGWQQLNWNGECLTVPQGFELDLGGLVKEFAADRLSVLLQEQSVAGLVNLAGDITASAPGPSGPWQVAVKHPRQPGALATLNLSQGAVAGSGDYERYMEIDGKRYCHILRPDTGYPAEHGLASVTVVADSCLLAGSIATTAMLKGQAAKNWLDEFECAYLAVDSSLKVFGTIEV